MYTYYYNYYNYSRLYQLEENLINENHTFFVQNDIMRLRQRDIIMIIRFLKLFKSYKDYLYYFKNLNFVHY